MNWHCVITLTFVVLISAISILARKISALNKQLSQLKEERFRRDEELKRERVALMGLLTDKATGIIAQISHISVLVEDVSAVPDINVRGSLFFGLESLEKFLFKLMQQTSCPAECSAIRGVQYARRRVLRESIEQEQRP